jgi:alkaline phosphatase D
VQCGDVTGGRATVWSRTDRPARLVVEYATTESFRDPRRVVGPAALASNGFTAKVVLTGLPADQHLFYRASFEDLAEAGVASEPVAGRFRTAPRSRRDVRLAWSGDTVGQGWGIDPARGGLRMYETMRRAQPHLFVNSGDLIYADNVVPAEIPLPDGTVWRNVVTPAKSKVAETIDEFRGNFAYPLQDESMRRFNAEVPVVAQWNDHEVLNNWYPGMRLEGDGRYTVKSASLLAAHARQAFFEYTPVTPPTLAGDRIYRSIPYGPLLELFVLDTRTYRTPNSENRDPKAGPALLGPAQCAWLKEGLRRSTALWKVVASDMPIGLVITDPARADGRIFFDAWSNGDPGGPAGREHETADLLRFIKRQGVANVVWITADVHYAAAHLYHPDRAAFKDFAPFWEFVAGPLHAGTFAPGALDRTFGPEVRFRAVPDDLEPNRPPSEGFQFFGTLDVAGKTGRLTAALHDVGGRELHRQELEPGRA